ncbi:xanthine dehydrogenase family protein molybdopterin-binding subunit [Rhodospirillaceae bacterium SYSU D60014]|uniref:xanthine dehydrogenase family protein molybdopterin-binding subunit n=1 Tax=Virgifigura deserti TaxID=2268457 RepID=UPI000E67518F
MTEWSITNISRRGLLKGFGSAGSLVLAAQILPIRTLSAQETPVYGAAAMPHGTVNNPHVFLSIDPDGGVTIVSHRAEMGQGVRTGLPMIVADELEADWSRVRVVQAPGDEPKYGNQDTDGSRSTRHFMQPMREAGAAARMMLEAAAAARWSVAADEVEAKNHEVTHKPSGRKLGYGELAADASALEVPEKDKIRLKDPSQFRYIGKDMPIIDGFDITTGRALYGIDTRLEGMKYAVIIRPPVFGGKVASLDSAEAMKVPGVEKIIELEGGVEAPSKFQPLGGVAVIARNTWAAIQGRDALKVTWDNGSNGSYDSRAYRKELETTARKPALIVRDDGDVDAAFGEAATTIEAEYYMPHLAQAPMEPPAATARIVDGKCDVWACVQAPQATRVEVSERLGLPIEDVTVNQTLLGGGFGRKSKPDFVAEAALLSKAMGGAPVKVTWTREDDIRHSYYHTVSVERIEAGLDSDGKPVAWRHRSVAPTIGSIFVPDPKHEAPFELGMGFVDLPFAIPNIRCENGEAAAHTRIGWFRSVSNIPHAFAIQSFAGELAAAAGKDQKDYLLELIGPARIADLRSVDSLWNYGESLEVYPIDTGRLRRVVEVAAEKAGWGRELPPGHGLGIAAHRSFVTYVATVVEARVEEDGALSIPRVDVAVDCGAYVNPDRIRSQMEGACIYGLSLALKSEISFKDGRVEQGNFDDYEVARIDEAPREIHIHLAEQNFDIPPGGVGEPGVPPFAPALTNAIFAATGKRIRNLPIRNQLRS